MIKSKIINKINIKNFKILQDIEINFTENINILLANNGLGKTSILQAITLCSMPLENIYKINDLEEYVSFNAENSEILLDWDNNQNRKLQIFKGSINEYKPLIQSKNLILSYGVNLNTNKEQNHAKIIDNLIKGNGKLYFVDSIFENNYNRLFDPIIILQDLLREYDISKNDEINEILKIYFETLNSFLDLIDGHEKIKISKSTINYFYSDMNNNKLQTNNLSEGYKDHLLLISDILIRIIAGRNLMFENEKIKISEIFKNAKAIVLIDEFDRHLHPVWQRKLLSKFKTDFPNIQFILTTHNPFSVQSAVGGTAIQLKIEDNKIVAINSLIKPKNILSIIREYFTKDFYDFETQNLLKQFSEYLEKIYGGETNLIESDKLKDIINQIIDKGEELKFEITSQLLQLNTFLKNNNKKEFVFFINA